RVHKYLCNIAGGRSAGSLKEIQCDLHIVGMRRAQELKREDMGKHFSAANLALVLGIIRGFENSLRRTRWIRFLPSHIARESARVVYDHAYMYLRRVNIVRGIPPLL